MKKWIIGYWIYKNDQWEDREKELYANNFDEVLSMIEVFTHNAKIRYVYEENNFSEKTTETEYLKAKKVISKYNKENNKNIDMTADEKTQHTDMKIALETALNFIIPDQLRKIIESTLKSLK